MDNKILIDSIYIHSFGVKELLEYLKEIFKKVQEFSWKKLKK